MKDLPLNKTTIEERTADFALQIMTLFVQLRKFPDFWVIANQISRSGTSIAANVAEGKFASSTKDFLYYRGIALKSAHETYFWLELCIKGMQGGSIPRKQDILHLCEDALQKVDEIEAILCKAVQTLQVKVLREKRRGKS